jgi:hypothetical protein
MFPLETLEVPPCDPPCPCCSPPAPRNPRPTACTTPPATAAREAFFDALWAGDYDAVDPIADDLTAEALDGDAASQALVGFAHAWTLAERRRAPEPDPGVTAHADLAVLAFERAVEQSPDDARLVGFRGSMLQAQGSIWGDAALQRKGWFDTAESARRWPEWGKFTQAYGLVTMDKDERLFARGVELYWGEPRRLRGRGGPARRPRLGAVRRLRGRERRQEPPRVRQYRRRAAQHRGLLRDHGRSRREVGRSRVGPQPVRERPRAGRRDLAVPVGRRAAPRGLAELPAWFAVEPAEDEAYDPRQNYVFGGPYGCTICHQGAPGGLVGAP